MNARPGTCLLVGSLLALAGCRGGTPAQTLTTGGLGNPPTLPRPMASDRPAELHWVPGPGGLELAAWPAMGQALVYCLVRNPTDGPVTCQGGSHGLGNGDLTVMWARPSGQDSWTRLPSSLERNQWRSRTGYIKAAVLEPGSELHRQRGQIEGDTTAPAWTFYAWPHIYEFPEDWSGEVELRVDCLDHHFPPVQLSMEVIRRQRNASDLDSIPRR